MRVMIVEDDAVLGLALEEALSRNGFAEVTLCPTAACSIAKLRQGSFDAVVLDVHLADRDDGWEIAELVDALGDGSVRIVFQTGAPGEIPAHIRQLGPVLTKPYDPGDLIAALQQKPLAGLAGLIKRK